MTGVGGETTGIYGEIGGADAVAATVDDFYRRVLGDPQLAHYFDGVDLRALTAHQRAFMAAALGGPQLYAGRDLGAAHAGSHITDVDFDAVVGHLVATLVGVGVAADTVTEIGARLEPLREQIVRA